jgi:hypothetical protein
VPGRDRPSGVHVQARGRLLLVSEGLTIGRIRDGVLLRSGGNDPPRALGLVVTLQWRRIFVSLGQVTAISVDGAYLLGGAVELDRFTRRTGEILASGLYSSPPNVTRRSPHSYAQPASTPTRTRVSCRP